MRFVHTGSIVSITVNGSWNVSTGKRSDAITVKSEYGLYHSLSSEDVILESSVKVNDKVNVYIDSKGGYKIAKA